MANEQVKDVLDSTRSVHERAHVYFANLASRCAEPRAKMLLDYLSEHEQRLGQAICDMQADAAPKVLDTWVNSVEPVGHLADRLDWDTASRSTASFDELVALGLEIDNKVIDIYSDLAQRAEPPWLRDTFQSLLEMEQQEEKLMAIQTLRGMDL